MEFGEKGHLPLIQGQCLEFLGEVRENLLIELGKHEEELRVFATNGVLGQFTTLTPSSNSMFCAIYHSTINSNGMPV